MHERVGQRMRQMTNEGDRAIAMVSLHFDLRRDLVAFLQSLDRQRGDDTR